MPKKAAMTSRLQGDQRLHIQLHAFVRLEPFASGMTRSAAQLLHLLSELSRRQLFEESSERLAESAQEGKG